MIGKGKRVCEKMLNHNFECWWWWSSKENGEQQRIKQNRKYENETKRCHADHNLGQ